MIKFLFIAHVERGANRSVVAKHAFSLGDPRGAFPAAAGIHHPAPRCQCVRLFLLRITRFPVVWSVSFLDSDSLTRWQQIQRTLCILPACSGRISYAL